MREVASFMQLYPAYQLRDVLNEYACSFYALLAEGQRLRYRHYDILSQVQLLPHVKPEERTRWFKQLEWASKHPSDILSSSGSGSSPADIKRVLG